MVPVIFLPVFLSTFSVRASAPPVLAIPLTSQLVPSNTAISSAFIIPASSALLANASSPFPALRVPPSWSFSIGFSGSTFTPPATGPQELSFAAQLDNGDPIPDWLVFAQDTITFGGVTPKENHGIQVLKIVVTASTSSNMTTSDAFTLIVSSHDLSLSGPLLTRNVTANNTFSIVLDDWQGVQVDGLHPNTSALSLASDNDPASLTLSLDTSAIAWLTYDASTRTLSGTPPTDAPVPPIPALVQLTFAQTSQCLTLATNLTLVVVPSLFTAQTLPALQAPPGTKIAFALAPFLAMRNLRRRSGPPAGMNVSAAWNPQNTTWLAFDPATLMLSGTVPQDAPDKVQVVFVARDEVRGTVSRAQMRISVDDGGGGEGGHGRLPTDHALRRAGKKIKLAVGVVFGVAAAVILLACFLAVCRQCCVAREHVDGAYVIDQTAFDAPYKSSLEKHEHDYASPALSTSPAPSPRLGRTMTKAAFFDAMRARFGSDGSWRVRRPRNASTSGTGGWNGSLGASVFGSGKRPRKSKIGKPMALLSSSTSVHDGFGQGAVGSVGNEKGKGKGKGVAAGVVGGNFTIFGGGNNASGEETTVPPPPTRPARPPLAVGRALMSSPGTALLAYDRSRSNSDPSRGSVHGSMGTGSPGKRRSGSAPSLGTGTRSGTQSTFATGEGDSTRLTNGAGEVPFRRPGFGARWETLAERSMREGSSFAAGSFTGAAGNVGAQRGIGRPVVEADSDGSQGLFFPPRALVKGAEESRSNSPPASRLPTPAKSQSSKASTPARSAKSTNTSRKGSPLNPTTQVDATPAKPVSDRSLGATSYRQVFFGDKGSESDESLEEAIITQVVTRSSSSMPVLVTPAKKPRLVPFTHVARTPGAADARGPRRDVSQRAVLQGAEESDPEAEMEMRMGLEYVRQLGGPDAHPVTTAHAHTPDPDAMRTPSAEYYASNDSNNSIAGRTRVLAPLVISSHRGRHQTGVSMASTHDSFVSRESRYPGEAPLPRFTYHTQEPLNFAVPLDQAHKHASVLAGSALEAKLADGGALPEWLRLESGGKEFWGVTPKVPTRVVLKIWDGETGEVVGGCVVDVLGDQE